MRIAPIVMRFAGPTLLGLAGTQAAADDSAASPAPAHSDSADADIVVVAHLPRPPAVGAYGGQHVSGERLQDTATGRLEEVLARLPGVQQFRRSDSRSANPSAQGLTVRGLGGNAASRTLLLLDGVPQSDSFFGFVPFTALPVDTLQDATVTRGSGVGPFGGGAVAGVIELTARTPADRPPLALTADYGSRNSAIANIAIARPLGTGHVSIDIRHDRGDGFFTTPANQRVAASVAARYRASTAILAATTPVGAGTILSTRLSVFRDDRTLRFSGADSRSQGVDTTLRLVTTGRWQVEALGWLQMHDFSTVVVSATSFRPTIDQRATPTVGWGGKVDLRLPAIAGRLTRIGLDVRGSDGAAIEDLLAVSGARTLTRQSGGRSFILGGFAEQDVVLGRLALTAGARIDHWRLESGFLDEVRADGSSQASVRFPARQGQILSGRGGIAWTVSPALVLRAAAYTGWRLPTLNELYRPFVVFPITTRANPALSPERLVGGEAGLTFRPAEGSVITVTAFDNRLSDAIANVTIGPNLRERHNVDAIASRGIEAEWHLAKGPWRMDGSYAYSDAQVRAPGTSLDRLRPAQTALHGGSISLGWNPAPRMLIQLGTRVVGAQFDDDRNTDRLPPAITVDGVITIPVGTGWTMSLRGENLADAQVVTRNAGGSIDLGQPRSIWIGLHWQAK